MLRVAIVGRPNVGKSALLNRLAKRIVSIVHDQPGVTRDRISVTVEREGKDFEFVDTGGIGLFESETTPKQIASAVEMQVEIAIQTSDLILFVVDGQEGLRPLDKEILRRLRKQAKSTWLLVNKIDIEAHENRAAEFHELGLDPTFFVSASHGRGMDELWEDLSKVEGTSQKVEGEKNEKKGVAAAIAIVGRPNVGKSSLTNRLLGAERVIVSEIPGTTRDSVELDIDVNGQRFSLIDTAGVRHKSAIKTHVEMYSRHWTKKSIERCGLALLIISSTDGVTRQDKEIARMIGECEKPCIILINKWDLNETFEKEYKGGLRAKGKMVKRRKFSRSEYEKEVRYQLPFLEYAPVMFVSALEGYHAQLIWNEVKRVQAARDSRFSTGILNRIVARVTNRVQPPMVHGKRLKIYYVTQKTSCPVPTFLIFVNQKRLWVDHYGRYLMNQLREENPMTGCPIVFILREHEKGPGKGRSELSE